MAELILLVGGIVSGLLAGLLGVGGGIIQVPLLVALGYPPIQAVATSSLAIVVTSWSGSVQNWRMGHLAIPKVLGLGLPSLVAAQIGVFLANQFTSVVLLSAYGILLLSNLYLVSLRQRPAQTESEKAADPVLARLVTGGAGGLLAGLFGVGGGVIMVPLQMVLLQEPIKRAVQTSLGAIAIASASACIGQWWHGQILFQEGLLLGLGGLGGITLSTRLLLQLPDRIVTLVFRSLLISQAVYIFWQAWKSV